MNVAKLIVFALLAVSMAGCNITINGVADNGIPGSGIPATENRDVTGYDEISIVGFGQVNIRVGKEDALMITGDDNLLGYIESSVNNGVLTIQPTESISPKTDMVFDISIAELTRVDLSAAANFDIQDVTGESLDVELKGSGNLDATGSVTSLKIEVNGAAKLDFEKLQAQDVEIEVNGAGKGVVYAGNSIDAEINGVGSVTVHGNPEAVVKEVNGIGRLNVLD